MKNVVKKEISMKIKYKNDGNKIIIDTTKPPFDGNSVLIRLRQGWVEAWWADAESYYTLDGTEIEGFCWICLDDQFQAELDEALEWRKLPK